MTRKRHPRFRLEEPTHAGATAPHRCVRRIHRGITRLTLQNAPNRSRGQRKAPRRTIRGSVYDNVMTHPSNLLAEDEPGPFEVVEGGAQSPFVILCDHAGRRLPRALGSLGLSDRDLERHIAW